jgi:hypothetical protein
MKVVHFSVLGCCEQSTGRSGFMPWYFTEKSHKSNTKFLFKQCISLGLGD